MRYAVAQHLEAWQAIAVVNIIGALCIGFIAAWPQLPQWVNTFAMGGVCGGFTTFSAFNLQTLRFMDAGRTQYALSYAGFMMVSTMLAVWLGYVLGSMRWNAPL